VFVYDTGPPMNIRFSDITSTSFVVQWDEVVDADWFNVLWWEDGGSTRENITTRTNITIRGLTPNTKYFVSIAAGNICGSVVNSDILSVTTLIIGSPVPILTVITIATTMSTMITSSTMITFCTTARPSDGKITLHMYIIHYHRNVYGTTYNSVYQKGLFVIQQVQLAHKMKSHMLDVGKLMYLP